MSARDAPAPANASFERMLKCLNRSQTGTPPKNAIGSSKNIWTVEASKNWVADIQLPSRNDSDSNMTAAVPIAAIRAAIFFIAYALREYIGLRALPIQPEHSPRTVLEQVVPTIRQTPA
jgi:hypothetical protein